MPNLDPWINQYENEHQHIITKQEEGKTGKFENYLLYFRNECQKTIKSNSHQHPTFLQRYQKIMEMLDWTLDRYGIIIQKNKIQQQEEQDLVIINRIVEELDEKRKITRNNITQSELRDEVAKYRLEETTIEDVLGEIGEFVNSR